MGLGSRLAGARGLTAVAAAALVRAVDPRAARIAHLDWDALVAEIAQCRSCPLGETASSGVFGVGYRHAEWMLVGEAPGAEEDARGEPFVGQAGKLLDNMLASIGLTRRGRDHAVGLHRERAEVPSTEQPQPRAGRSGQMRAVPAPPGGTRRSKAGAGDGPFRRAGAAGHRRQHRQPARTGAPHRHASGAAMPVVVTYHPAYLLRNLATRRSRGPICASRARSTPVLR
jgi:uracil-DNA glycosylase